MEVILKYLQTIIDTILKLPGLVFFIFLFPFFASIVVDIFRIQILQLFGFNIPNEILTGILVGFILFASLSLFSIELRILDLPKFSKFNKNKFIISIFIMPMIIGIISKSYNINLDYNDFILIKDFLYQNVFNISININNSMLEHFMFVFKILPVAIATVYFIKLYIYTLIVNIFNLLTIGLLIT